ncbi:hypothetical protein AgCh_017499 [Apium graveolens]
MRDIVELIRGCLAAAQDRQRKYADLARKDREYEVGDQGQECQAIQSLVEISQGRGVDLGIRDPPARKTTSMNQTRTAVRRRVRNAREFRRLFVRQPRQVLMEVKMVLHQDIWYSMCEDQHLLRIVSQTEEFVGVLLQSSYYQ